MSSEKSAYKSVGLNSQSARKPLKGPRRDWARGWTRSLSNASKRTARKGRRSFWFNAGSLRMPGSRVQAPPRCVFDFQESGHPGRPIYRKPERFAH